MSNSATEAEESGARARTRRAILAAAIDALAKDGGASLGEVAAAGEVSRTTLHRYFPERSDLVRAVVDEAMARIAAATERAGLDQGPVPEAIERACREYFELGPVLTVLFSGAVEIADEDWERYEAADPERGLAAAVARGQAEGSVDPDLPAAWIENVVWALLYSAWNYGRETDAPRQAGIELCLRSARKAIAA